MAHENRDFLETLKFELKFLEDGGYGRSPHTPWRPTYVFEDSPTCLNFGDPFRPHPCTECFLMQFVPLERREESVPCRFIPLTEKGETIEYFYRCGTQIELEEALKQWLRTEIARIEKENASIEGAA
ncbi:MAG TPA: hypothetical protein VH744_03230 [Terriglobales bacterium]|jgi:hypothetical protein